jgi:hypothetical protein
LALLLQATIIAGRAPQGTIKPAGLTVVINVTFLAVYHTRLHPDTGPVRFGGFMFVSNGIHFHKPIPALGGAVIYLYRFSAKNCINS